MFVLHFPLLFFYFVTPSENGEADLVIIKDEDGCKPQTLSSSVMVTQGDDLSLVCKLVQNGQYMDDQTIWGKKTAQYETNISERKLLLKDITADDQGEYFCLNIRHDLVKTIFLKVLSDASNSEPNGNNLTHRITKRDENYFNDYPFSEHVEHLDYGDEYHFGSNYQTSDIDEDNMGKPTDDDIKVKKDEVKEIKKDDVKEVKKDDVKDVKKDDVIKEVKKDKPADDHASTYETILDKPADNFKQEATTDKPTDELATKTETEENLKQMDKDDATETPENNFAVERAETIYTGIFAFLCLFLMLFVYLGNVFLFAYFNERCCRDNANRRERENAEIIENYTAPQVLGFISRSFERSLDEAAFSKANTLPLTEKLIYRPPLDETNDEGNSEIDSSGHDSSDDSDSENTETIFNITNEITANNRDMDKDNQPSTSQVV